MKKLTAFVFTWLLLSLVGPLSARAMEADVYAAAMVAAAVAGDAQAGQAAESARNAALAEQGSAEPRVSWAELNLLSKALYAVTGNRTFTEEWRLCVGEVILNRVESPEFPDSLEEVIWADERYCGKVDGYFDALRPDSSCASIAFRLLSGERVMNEKSVVYQDEHYYDGGVYHSLYDYRVGGIFFCCSTRPHLYQ